MADYDNYDNDNIGYDNYNEGSYGRSKFTIASRIDP